MRSVRNCLICVFLAVFFAVPSFAQDGVVDLKRVCGSYSAYKKTQEKWNAIVQQKMRELSVRCSQTKDESRRQQITEEYSKQLKTQQLDFFLPVSVEIQKATAAVAKEKNLQAVYDVATGKRGIDITNDVISKLNSAESQKTQAKSVKNANSQPKKITSVTVQPAQSNAAVQVQFGSSPNKGGIDALVAKAVKFGFSNAYACEGIDKNGRKIWRARIPAASTAEAKQVSAQLTQRKINNFITK